MVMACCVMVLLSVSGYSGVSLRSGVVEQAFKCLHPAWDHDSPVPFLGHIAQAAGRFACGRLAVRDRAPQELPQMVHAGFGPTMAREDLQVNVCSGRRDPFEFD